MPEVPPQSPRAQELSTLGGVERAEAMKARIDAATSFEDLYDVLGEIGNIPGGHKVYPAKELIGIIKGVHTGGLPSNLITVTYGIRDKVIALIEAEQQGKKE